MRTRGLIYSRFLVKYLPEMCLIKTISMDKQEHYSFPKVIITIEKSLGVHPLRDSSQCFLSSSSSPPQALSSAHQPWSGECLISNCFARRTPLRPTPWKMFEGMWDPQILLVSTGARALDELILWSLVPLNYWGGVEFSLPQVFGWSWDFFGSL